MKKESIGFIILIIFLFFVGGLSIKKMIKKTTASSDFIKINNENNINNTNYDNQEEKSMPASLSANKKMTKPEMTIDQNKQYEATLQTSEGDIVISLNAQATPITVNNFVHLAKSNFYNGTIFHRVINGFMIQGGDPRGDGTGGPGYQFDDEAFTGKYIRGTVAMANAGANTNGSQFFIMHQDSALQPNYVIFGQVTSGMEVVDQIATAAVKSNFSGEVSKPVTPITVQTVTITEK
jgi:cyclophilin family peptidyl-prolyl cis-trans isomerase